MPQLWLCASLQALRPCSHPPYCREYFDRQDTVDITLDSIHVFYLSEMSVEKIISVKLNNQTLILGMDYCALPGGQWISTKSALQIGDRIIIEYIASQDRDLIVTNWDNDIGNYLFYNQSNPTIITYQDTVKSELSFQVYPNPFNQQCTFKVQVPLSQPLE